MSKNRNCTIDILRIFFAVTVVALHTDPFVHISAIGNYFFSQVLSRLAVPFFGTVAGYFFFRSNNGYKKAIKKYFVIYTFWSVLMLAYDASRWNDSAKEFSIYCLKTIFLTGWNHLWYLLAIIYTIIILLIANRISEKANDVIYYCSFVFLTTGIAVNNYGNVVSKLPLFGFVCDHSQSFIFSWLFLLLPFFMMGYAFNRYWEPSNVNKAFTLMIVFIICFFSEVLVTTLLDLHRNVSLCLFTYPVVYFMFTWALNNPQPKLAEVAKYAAGMASVIYFAHNVFALYLRSNGLTEFVTFAICTVLPAIVGDILVKINNPVINRLI